MLELSASKQPNKRQEDTTSENTLLQDGPGKAIKCRKHPAPEKSMIILFLPEFKVFQQIKATLEDKILP